MAPYKQPKRTIDNLGRRTDRVHKPEVKEMIRLRDAGRDEVQIAEELNRDTRTVKRILSREDMKKERIEPKGEDQTVELRRQQHFEKLASEADKLVHSLVCTRAGEEIKDVALEDIMMTDEDKQEYLYDSLERCLIDHIRDEVPELAGIKNSLQLRVMDITNELLDKLSVIAYRKTFRGTCRICKDWPSGS